MKQLKLCKQCIRWKLFKNKCNFLWEGKKECFSKANSIEEMKQLDNLRGRE